LGCAIVGVHVCSLLSLSVSLYLSLSSVANMGGYDKSVIPV